MTTQLTDDEVRTELTEEERSALNEIRCGSKEDVSPDIDFVERAFALSRRQLRECIDKFPWRVYGEAQSDGCDANGAYDCFCDAIREWLAALPGKEAQDD